MGFDLTIGGTPQVRAYLGTTPIKRTYVGGTHVWPPFSTTVTWVASQVFSGTTSTAFPTHAVGDLLVIAAHGITAPTAPTGWTVVRSTTDTTAPNVTLAYRYAAATNTVTGSWMNNAYGTAYVFRGARRTNPIGAFATDLGATASTAVTAPALTQTDTSGASLVTHSYYNTGSTGGWVNKSPGNFYQRNLNARLANNQAIDTTTTVVESSTMTHTFADKWRSTAFEVLPDDGRMWVVSANTVSGATGTFTGHQPGDLLITIAQIQNTTAAFSPPTPPNTGGTVPTWHVAYDSNISSVQGAPNLSAKIGYAVATASNHTSGTWTNAVFLTTIVVRGADQTNPLGGVAGDLQTNITAPTITTPSVTMVDRSGNSMVFGYLCSSSTSASNCYTANPPEGWTSRVRTTKTAIDTRFDGTGAGVTESHTISGLNWRTATFEVKSAPGAIKDPPYLYDVEIEYLPNYEVRFTALTGYDPDPDNDAFFFRATPDNGSDGYKGRTFTAKFTPTVSAQNCTLQDYWGGPDGDARTITFQVTPRP
jgi:hypothetical protein